MTDLPTHGLDEHARRARRSFAPPQTTDAAITDFIAAMTPQLLKAVGQLLLHRPIRSVDQRQAIQVLKAHFWRALDLAPRHCQHPPPSVVPKGEDVPDSEVRVLRHAIERLGIDKPSRLNRVTANTYNLVAHLHLSSTEAKLLTWSYALQRTEHCGLRELVNLVKFDDANEMMKGLSALFAEPAAAIARTTNAPCQVLALRFVDATAWHRAKQLSDVLSLTDETLWLLEYEHRSVNSLLTFLLEPEFDAEIVGRDDCTSAGLYESLPQAVAEAYELARRERPLNIHQLPAMIHWFTLMEIPPEQLQPLARKFMLEPLREVIKRCFVTCGRANQPVTPFLLLKALYAAAE